MGLKQNIILNYINTLTSIIFPIITFPYAARILSPAGIGTVDFLDSIINYIILFTNLGIPFYGIKEIAKFRDNIKLRNKKTIELLCLNIILAICGYIVVYIISVYSAKVNKNIDIFYILSLAIFFNAIGAQWFYQAIEDFKFITIRAVIIRIVFMVYLFLFVRTSTDVIFYAIFLVGSTVSNYLINFIHLRKFLLGTKIRLKELNIRQHLTPTLKVFFMFVFVSVYLYLNTILLGFLQDDKSVGYYAAGIKIIRVINTLVTSVGAVVVPRCSNLLHSNNQEDFNNLITKSYHFMMAMSLPISAILILLATPITTILCGKEFSNSISVLIITSPTVIFVTLSNIIGMQILFPMNKEKIIILATGIASFVNILVNIILVPLIAEKGAAYAIALAELSIFITEYKIGKKYIPFKLITKNIKQYFIGTCVMSLGVVIIMPITNNIFNEFILCGGVGLILYTGYLYLTKESITMELFTKCSSIIKKKNI